MESKPLVKIDKALLISGFLFLLIGSFFDNLRGPLLTFLTKHLNLTYDQSSWFLVLGHLVGLFFTLLLLPLNQRFSEAKVGTYVVLVSAVFCFSALLVSNYLGFLIFAGSIGAVVALFGTLSNIVTLKGTPKKMQVRILSALHFFYGVGSILGPLLASQVLGSSMAWQWLVFLALPFFIPIWYMLSKSAKDHRDLKHRRIETSKLNLHQVLVLILFASYVVGEVMISMWMVTYLVEVGSFDLSQASLYLTAFFVLMAFSRFLCFLFAKPSHETSLMWFSLLIPALGIIFTQMAGWFFVLPMLGLIGPFFPVFLGQLTRVFPDDWKALTIWIMVSLQLFLASAHLVLGQIITSYGAWISYWIPLIFLMIAAILFVLYRKRVRLLTRRSHNERLTQNRMILES